MKKSNKKLSSSQVAEAIESILTSNPVEQYQVFVEMPALREFANRKCGSSFLDKLVKKLNKRLVNSFSKYCHIFNGRLIIYSLVPLEVYHKHNPQKALELYLAFNTIGTKPGRCLPYSFSAVRGFKEEKLIRIGQAQFRDHWEFVVNATAYDLRDPYQLLDESHKGKLIRVFMEDGVATLVDVVGDETLNKEQPFEAVGKVYFADGWRVEIRGVGDYDLHDEERHLNLSDEGSKVKVSVTKGVATLVSFEI
jgi:hypothetical protein